MRSAADALTSTANILENYRRPAASPGAKEPKTSTSCRMWNKARVYAKIIRAFAEWLAASSR
jgi:hypothetical protein